jgi:DNA-binding beta-propeller fold protein YncE
VAASWGRTGSGEGEFRDPWGIAVAPDGAVYVADTWNHRVQKFDAEGRFLLQWGHLADAGGQLGVEPGGFWGPRDIAISSSGNVYVTDTGNKRVQVFTPEGEFVTMFGGGGGAPGQMDEPVGIAIAADGSIYVADTWNRRVQRFDAQHQFQGSWSVEGWEGQSVVNKPYLTVAPDGGVYAVVPERGEVVRLSPDGGVERLRLPSGLTLGLPIGIATDQAGALLVADSRNQVVVRVPRP